MRGILLALLIVLGIFALGYLLTAVTVPHGIDRFRQEPVREDVARRSLEVVRRLHEEPLTRLLLPAASVEEVAYARGTCPSGEPGSFDIYGDYVARVRAYTWFRIPARTIAVWCGGAAYGASPPDPAPDPFPPPEIDKGLSMRLPLPAVQIASARADLDGDGVAEEVELRADVQLGPGGSPIWEDGHRWAIVVRGDLSEQRLVDTFIPQGRMKAWVVEPDEGLPIVVVLRESGTSGIELLGFRWGWDSDGFGYDRIGRFEASGRIAALLDEQPGD